MKLNLKLSAKLLTGEPTFTLEKTFHPFGDPIGEDECNAYTVVAKKDGVYAGHVEFVVRGGRLEAADLEVEPEFQRQGIASAMYTFAEQETGLRTKPHQMQSPEGQAFWNQKHRMFGAGEELEVEDIDQEFSGKGTSLTPKQMRGGLPALFRKITDWPTGGRVFDIGAGRPEMVEALKEWFATKNITYLPYDKFNGDTYNQETMTELKKEKADMATASNLLNVIPDVANRTIVLKRMWNALKPGGTVHITAHRESGKTEGPSGKDSWQNHKAPIAYLDEVKAIFPNAIVAHDMITATK